MAALLGYLFARERREVYHDVNPDCRKLVHGPLTSDLMRRCRHILAHRTDQVDSQTQLDFNDIMRVLKDLNMTPSRAQVEEMLQFAAECSGRPTSTYLTFGELCLFAVDLQGSSDGGSSDYHFDKVVHRRKRLQSANPDIGVRYQVFLGGSCNPTTWRCDIVIPILEEAGVTFYNPQVDRWCDGLIEVEEQAKQSADLCLFVIDNQTRGVASMVEAAYLAASGHPIILVMVDFGENVEIEGIPLSPRELQDLNRGRIFVSNLMAWQGLPIFTDIATAARACCKVLNSGISVTSLGPSDGAQPAKLTGASVGRKLLAVHEAFSHCKLLQLSTVSRKEVSLVLRSLCLPNVEAECDINSVLPCPHDDGDESYDFNEFCSLAAEMMSQSQSKTLVQSTLNGLSHLISRWLNVICRFLFIRGRSCTYFREVFLGGSCGGSTWRQKITIPMLRKHAVSFYNPHVSRWSVRFLPVEAEAKAKCWYLLFVIDDSCRSVASLVEVAGFIGEGRRVVLCRKFMKEGTEVDGHQVTGRALRDYNRGRSYVSEYANQQNVPVFDSEAEATQCVIARLRGQDTVDKATRALRGLRGSVSLARTSSLSRLYEQT